MSFVPFCCPAPIPVRNQLLNDPNNTRPIVLKGPRGTPGAPGTSRSVVPYSSGTLTALALVTDSDISGNILSTGASLGFGLATTISASLASLSNSPGNISVTNLLSANTPYTAFVMPRDGFLTDLSIALATALIGLTTISIANPLTLSAVVQLYKYSSNDSAFVPIPNALLTIPLITNANATVTISPGTIYSGSISFSPKIPVSKNDQILLYVYLEETNQSLVSISNFNVVISGGLGVELQ